MPVLGAASNALLLQGNSQYFGTGLTRQLLPSGRIAGCDAAVFAGHGRLETAYLAAVQARHPQHIAGAILVGMAGRHEQMIRQPVDIAERGRIDPFGILQCGDQPFGPPGDGTGQMKVGGRRTSAGSTADRER